MPLPTRDEQIAMMTGAEDRRRSNVDRWLRDPAYIAALREMRPRPVTSFFAGLTPEQQAAVLAYDGPDDLGDPAFLRPLPAPVAER